MSLFAISDTHLSFGTDKPMDSFPGWNDYVCRIEKNWNSIVENNDTVVIAGDISWAMKLEETFVDLVRKYSYTEYDSENRKEPKNKWTFFNTDKRDGFFNLMVKDFMDVITDLYNNLNYNSSDEFIQTN